MALIGQIATKLKRWDDRRYAVRNDELDRSVAALASRPRADAADSVGLAGLVGQAWTIGQQIDMSGVGYGPAHWQGSEKFVATPSPYYHFLAGLVRVLGCRRIFEVGTHFGGSVLAMKRGIAEPSNAKILTVDVTDLNSALHSLPGLRKIVGNANEKTVVQESVLYFKGQPIDLMYVDADHSFMPTITNIGLYGILLRPAVLVIDDIVLNETMRAMWDVLKAAYGSDAVNCVDIVPEIRSAACGFGLVRLR